RICTINPLAVLIPAHNESKSIARCVKGVAACAVPPGVEILIVVVADNCSDATAQIARAAGARVIERVDPARRGKGFALRYAFNQLLREGADGTLADGILVIDADSLVQPNALVEV